MSSTAMRGLYPLDGYLSSLTSFTVFHSHERANQMLLARQTARRCSYPVH